MSIPLLAAQSPDPSVPWWWQTVFVPVALGLLSALFGTLAAQRTEWYRRIARWEPYGRELWQLQATLYREACQAARRAKATAYNMAFHWKNGEPEHNKPIDEAHRQATDELDSLQIQSHIFLSAHFNDVFAQFSRAVFSLSQTHPEPQFIEQAIRRWEETQALYGQLMEAARASVGTDKLGTKTLEAIVSNLNAIGEKAHTASHDIAEGGT